MKSVVKKSVAVVCAAAAVLLVVFIYGNLSAQKNKTKGEFSVQRLSEKTAQPQKSFGAEILQNSLKSVVGITSTQNNYSENAQRQYMGSGVIVSEDGYIITNQHVIGANSVRIEVTLSDGESKAAQLSWSNAALDLAVIKINGDGYAYSKMGSAASLEVGEGVMAIGNPLSMQFERTVTAGIVSAVGRSIDLENEDGTTYYMEDLIQTDASINPGNSGGPLIDKDGNVVGINTVKVTSAEGMGFAVPVNVCSPVISALRSKGSFKTPYMGLYAYTPAAARYFGHEDVLEDGLFAAKLDENGPARAAGVRYADIITQINDKKVKTMLDLREELYQFQSGDEVTLTLKRDGAVKKIKVRLADMP